MGGEAEEVVEVEVMWQVGVVEVVVAAARRACIMSCWYSLVWVRHSQIVSVCTLSRSTEISQSPLSLKHTACTPPLPSPLISSASPPASPAFASPFAFFLPTSCSSCMRESGR